VSGSEPGMDTAIDLIKSFDNVMAKGQQFFVPGEGHSSVSPFDGFGPFITLPARLPVFKSGIPRRIDELEQPIKDCRS
jgi:hypothetical protein